MVEYLSISKQSPQFPAYLNFQDLRQIGITRLPQLTGKIWTDYNLHDPGVTILEVLCYAITDLGYRNNLEIENLLALKPGTSENNFFTPNQILTCNPVTMLDIRKRLIDIRGVNNAWLEKVDIYDPPIWIDTANNRLRYAISDEEKKNGPLLHPRGLYKVYLDLDPDYHKNACGQLERSWSDVLNEVRQVLCRYRNLCEDIHDIVILDEEEIKLCADIELKADADGEDVLVEVYERIQDFLVPQIRFYTLQQLLEKNQSIADIFAGRPAHDDHDQHYESHGFIDIHELENLTLPKILHTSDLYQKILGGSDVAAITGVAAIKKLLIASSINGLPQSQESPWYLQLTPQYRPVLSIEGSTIRLFKNGLLVPVNLDEVKRRYYEQRSAYIKTKRDPYELDLTVPLGKYSANLASHYSIHHDFPLTYGIGEDGLPEPVSAQRQAQAKQLKGYLVFFDQLLANYLAQLAHVRNLFSWEVTETQTYFNQAIQFPGSNEILQENYLPLLPFWWKWYCKIQRDRPLKAEAFDLWFISLAYHLISAYYLSEIAEEEETYRDRRNRFLDHLLARFAESFTDYVLLNYRMVEKHRDKPQHELHLIEEKADFIKNYPVISRDRFRAFNYCNCKKVWDTDNVSGFKKRVSRLLGIEDARRRNLNHYHVIKSDPGGFIVFIGCGSPDQELRSQQVYTSQEEARAGLQKFLSFALCANFYQPLTYNSFYHYSWEVEVMDTGQLIQARCDTFFLSHRDRSEALTTLLKQLSELDREACILIQSTETDDPSGSNRYYFQLKIPPAADEIGGLQFTGVQRYFDRETASTKARVLLNQMGDSRNYYRILWRQNGGSERETQNPSHEAKWIYYGYALVDNKGTLLAESRAQFPDRQNRDRALYNWLSNLRAESFHDKQITSSLTGSGSFASRLINPQHQDQFEFAIQQIGQEFFFVLQHATDDRVVLRSLKSYKDETQAWNSAYLFAENLFHLNRYISPAQDEAGQAYVLGVTDENGKLLAIAETENEPLAMFKHLNSVEPFLLTQAVQVESQPEQTLCYRCQLSDRNGTILLEATQLFNDVDTARDRFYQDVLGVLFEPGMLYSSTSREGFGFGVLSRPGDPNSKVAVHPQTYASEQERDAAVNQLFLLVRTARITVSITPQEPAFIGQITQNGSILLQGTQRYVNEEEAWKRGNLLMELASVEVELPAQGNPDGKNFRLIDAEDGSSQGVYGWELTNETKDQILASHFYKSQRDRNQAIKKLQQQVNDEGFHVLEHILLRPRQPLMDPPNPSENLLPIYVDSNGATALDREILAGEIFTIARRDPYSFWVTVVLPYWPTRFQDIKFRRFVERTLRLEAPAHIVLKIAWINTQQMYEFETAYRAWLEQLAAITCVGEACDWVGSLNHLIDLLPNLLTVYPQGTLHDPQVSSDRSNPIILNQTALGNIQDEGHEHDD